ncbi:unnamed protein product [Rhodiola kirilowii]
MENKVDNVEKPRLMPEQIGSWPNSKAIGPARIGTETKSLRPNHVMFP